MPDMHERNQQFKATMRERNSGNLNSSGKAGVVVCSPTQTTGARRPTRHVEVGTGRKL
jgi:hypothetical protein